MHFICSSLFEYFYLKLSACTHNAIFIQGVKYKDVVGLISCQEYIQAIFQPKNLNKEIRNYILFYENRIKPYFWTEI